MVRLLLTWGELFGYRIFFWSRETGEPVHVHVCKGSPTENATKIWKAKLGQLNDSILLLTRTIAQK